MRVGIVTLLLPLAGCYLSHAVPEDGGGVADAGRDVGDAGTDAVPFGRPPVCVLDGPTATLEGTTPLGPIDLPDGYAGLGNTGKACFGVALHWTDRATLFLGSSPERQLYVWLPIPEVEPIVGSHHGVTATYVVGAEVVTTDAAEIEIRSYTRDDVTPAVEATIRIVEPGWDVSGTIAAPYCRVFADPCL